MIWEAARLWIVDKEARERGKLVQQIENFVLCVINSLSLSLCLSFPSSANTLAGPSSGASERAVQSCGALFRRKI